MKHFLFTNISILILFTIVISKSSEPLSNKRDVDHFHCQKHRRTKAIVRKSSKTRLTTKMVTKTSSLKLKVKTSSTTQLSTSRTTKVTLNSKLIILIDF